MLVQESKGRPDRVSKGKPMDGDFPEHQITAGEYVTLLGYLTQSGSLYMLAKGKARPQGRVGPEVWTLTRSCSYLSRANHCSRGQMRHA